jgi:uncharacterized membrane protein
MYYASDFRRMAREALIGRWGLAVITSLVAGLLGAEYGVNLPDFEWRQEYSNLVSSDYGALFLSFFAAFFGFAFIYGVVVFIIGSAIQLGYIRFNRNILDRANPQFMDIFSRFQIFGKAFLLRLLMTIFTFLWSLLFIIPGIIAAYSYAMAPYILEENPNMTASEAIAYSKDMMRGNKWRLFCLQISFIGWSILCLFTCGIGFLWLTPYTYMAEVAFFYDVSGKFSGQYGQFQQNGQYNQYQQGQQDNQYNQGQQYQSNGYQQNGYQQNGYQSNWQQQNGYQQNDSQQNGYQQDQQNQNQYNQYQQNGYQQNTDSSTQNGAEKPGQSSTDNQSDSGNPNNTSNL